MGDPARDQDQDRAVHDAAVVLRACGASASLSQGQEAFLESHVYAFDRLGGVPLDQIRYDNLKPAVTRVLFGRNRVESDRWVCATTGSRARRGRRQG